MSSVDDLQDPRRREPSYLLGERDMLEAWLEFHRTTLLLKCEGLDDLARKNRPIPTSLLSLHGLVRHLAEVERNWFQRILAGRPDVPWLWSAEDDSDFTPIDDADWDQDVATWQAECEASRAVAAGMSLDDTGLRRGQSCSLRWVYVHMIEEYARHNGHADLLRELADRNVGW
jgi:uncharacterized damage-inducible protein DinB